jgi:hypothetical protein
VVSTQSPNERSRTTATLAPVGIRSRMLPFCESEGISYTRKAAVAECF